MSCNANGDLVVANLYILVRKALGPIILHYAEELNIFKLNSSYTKLARVMCYCI